MNTSWLFIEKIVATLILEWIWDSISMDFVSSFPRTNLGHDAIRVIMDGLMKSFHFIPINMLYKLHQRDC